MGGEGGGDCYGGSKMTPFLESFEVLAKDEAERQGERQISD